MSWENLLKIIKRFSPEKVGSARNVSYVGIVNKKSSLLWKRQCPKDKLAKGKLSEMVVFRDGG